MSSFKVPKLNFKNTQSTQESQLQSPASPIQSDNSLLSSPWQLQSQVNDSDWIVYSQNDSNDLSTENSIYDDFVYRSSSENDERIESWRRDQVKRLLRELYSNSHISLRASDVNDLLKQWKLDSAQRPIKIKRLYGDFLIQKYSGETFDSVKAALRDLSIYLKQSIREEKDTKSIRGYCMNPTLEKYMPPFLKSLINDSKLYWKSDSVSSDRPTSYSEEVMGF